MTFFLPWNTTEDILKNNFFPYNEREWGPKHFLNIFGVPHKNERHTGLEQHDSEHLQHKQCGAVYMPKVEYLGLGI